MIKVTRKTTESNIEVCVSEGPVSSDYRKKIVTPMPFLSHMIEHIAWRSGLNISTAAELADFNLTHVICEDLGQALGKALAAYLEESSGCRGFGDGIGIIDEARSLAAVSFENRAYCDISYDVMPALTESTLSEDLETFVDGIAQGGLMTIQLDIQRGKNGHHIWESAFRALGLALGNALKSDNSRRGMTAGVAGKIDFTVQKD